MINKVDISLKGKYTCEADNGVGAKLAKSISISVRGNEMTVLDFKRRVLSEALHFVFSLHEHELCKYLSFLHV